MFYLFEIISFYKKRILIWIWVFLVLIIIVLFFLVIFEEKINERKLKKEIPLNEKQQEEILQNYDYYQVYIYPQTFNLNCQSSDDKICNILEKNSPLIKDFSLFFIGKELDYTQKSLPKLDLNFLDKEKNEKIIYEIFKLLYVGKWEKKDTSEYEDFFDFKIQETNEERNLTDMEINCIEWIKNSIIPWTYNEEIIIKERVQEECKNFSNTPEEIFNLWENIALDKEKNEGENYEKDIELSISISELRIKYIFFVKEKWNFIEKHSEEKKVNKILNLHSSFSTKEIIWN